MNLAYVLGILIMVLGIMLSVALHELGHMIPAKKFGVKVPEYFIGFGPTLWSVKKGETRYGVKAILLGGYVKLVGMLPPAPAGKPDKRLPNGELGLVGQARADALAELEPGEENRAFYSLSVPKKLIVMSGGIIMNFILAVVFLAVSISVVGIPTYTSTVNSVATCVTTSPTGTCSKDDPVAPAHEAGFLAGDRIVSWNGELMNDWADVQRAIAHGGSAPAQVVITRDGHEQTLAVTPVLVERPVLDASGRTVPSNDGSIAMEQRPYVGIGPSLETVRGSLTELPHMTLSATWQTIRVVATLPVGLYHVVAAGLGFEERSANGIVGLVGVGRMAGQVASGGSGDIPLSVRISTMLSLLASLNLALFAFNLLPFLPLDGGHIAGALWEGLRRRIATLQGQSDPGPVDTARLIPVGQTVIWILIIMTLVLVWADIVAPV
ncbi:M50 family metallopeptidase [Actinomyces vulturis]|uniref:M50 family metallopeptidase n=1 Tax=Actinomyces vulturis TaxID=1857645 RepID=UPI00082C4C60|nr:site-2 protease family protein [Actinomyces vulturis]